MGQKFDKDMRGPQIIYPNDYRSANVKLTSSFGFVYDQIPEKY